VLADIVVDFGGDRGQQRCIATAIQGVTPRLDGSSVCILWPEKDII
jgi:hypothetical protein